MPKGLRLDLGCGPSPRDGYEGVDIVPGSDYCMDLQEFPWPWKANSVEAAFSSHLVEHLPDLVGFMRELYRVMKPGARVEIHHPYQFNVRAWQDPTHVRCINEVSWHYFDMKWRGGTSNTWGGYGNTDFTIVELDAIPHGAWKEVLENDPVEFEKAAASLINVISDLHVVLECRKDG
jgi:SAM-dependent methyltransferase